MNHFNEHIHNHAGFGAASNNLHARHVHMAPRSPHPEPVPGEGLTDFGDFINATLESTGYFHGLNGVNQELNYLLTNALVVSFFALLGLVLGYRWLHMSHSHLRKLMAMGRFEDQRYWMYNHHKKWPSSPGGTSPEPCSRQSC